MAHGRLLRVSSWIQAAAAAGPAAWLAFLLAVTAVASAWSYGGQFAGQDFYLHWAVAQKIGDADVGSIYSDAGRQRIGAEFAESASPEDASWRLKVLADAHPEPMVWATPVLYSVFWFFFTEDYDTDFALYRLFSLACTVFTLVVFGRALGFSFTAVLLAVAVFTEFFEPFRSATRTGNVSQVQLGLLAAYYWLQREPGRETRSLLAGVLLGAAVLFKPNLAVVAVLALVYRSASGEKRRLRLEFLGLAGGAAGAFLVSLLVFGSFSCWSEWLANLRQFLDAPPDLVAGNYAFANFLSSQAGFDISKLLLGVLLLGAAAFVATQLRRFPAGSVSGARAAAARDEVLLIGLGSVVMLLAAPVAWLHYYNLAVPLALYALRPAEGELPGPPSWKPLRVGAAFLAVFAAGLLPGRVTGWGLEVETYAAYSYAGVLLLLLIAVADPLLRNRGVTAASAPAPD